MIIFGKRDDQSISLLTIRLLPQAHLVESDSNAPDVDRSGVGASEWLVVHQGDVALFERSLVRFQDFRRNLQMTRVGKLLSLKRRPLTTHIVDGTNRSQAEALVHILFASNCDERGGRSEVREFNVPMRPQQDVSWLDVSVRAARSQRLRIARRVRSRNAPMCIPQAVQPS